MVDIGQEIIKIESGMDYGGSVAFEDLVFTEIPKIILTPLTNKDCITKVTHRSLTGFTFKVKEWKKHNWKESKKIPVMWIAIQEK